MKAQNALEKALKTFMSGLASIVGKPHVFMIVFFAAAGWFIAGLWLEYDTWFDIMDVFVFLTTFFLLFVIQSSQNADTEAIQDKLDEVI